MDAPRARFGLVWSSLVWFGLVWLALICVCTTMTAYDSTPVCREGCRSMYTMRASPGFHVSTRVLCVIFHVICWVKKKRRGVIMTFAASLLFLLLLLL